MGIIAGVQARIKRIPADWVIVAIIVLASSASFGLGFLSGRDVGEKGELRITEREMADGAVPLMQDGVGEELVTPEPLMNAGGQYVASKSGKSYHLPWCSGAKLIKEETKVWFESKEAAEARGYAPAGNCPGI